MINAVIACSLVFSLGGVGADAAQVLPLQFKQTNVAKNISQLLRSNADHFWAYSRDPRMLKDLVNYTAAEGVISGDSHLGNTTVIPVKTKSGKEELRFLNVDFDDGGRGPFALEFARFATVAKASSKDIKIKQMLAAYLNGLDGREMEMPTSIAKTERVDIQSYEVTRAAYVANKMSGGHFKYEAGEIEKWEGHPNSRDVAPFFKGAQVLEVAKRPMERGGSVEGIRLWVLIQDNAGAYRIVELKQYLDTALSAYSRQPEPRERIKSLHETYWEGLDPSTYDLVDIQGVTFWVREKKVEILTYKNKVEEDEGRVYLANLIGLTQGKQAAGPKYSAAIARDTERFKEAIKEYVQGYLEIAKDSME
jgi:hypothetical protein